MEQAEASRLGASAIDVGTVVVDEQRDVALRARLSFQPPDVFRSRSYAADDLGVVDAKGGESPFPLDLSPRSGVCQSSGDHEDLVACGVESVS